jgi:hypothetical protein
MIDNLIFTIGLINIALLIIAIIVIVYNNKMTTTGRVLRVIEILVFPILGPIIVLIEVLSWKIKEDKIKKTKATVNCDNK